jgi:hypothetical protein
VDLARINSWVYLPDMDLPFSLTEQKDGTLRYGVTLGYRLFSVVVLGVLVFALVSPGAPPSVIGWLLLALSAFGALYEDTWIFRPKTVTHKVGLIFAARRTELLVSEIEGLRILPFVSGTVPGSAEEVRENAKALTGEDAQSPGRKYFSGKRSYLILILVAKGGAEYSVDRIPARKRDSVRRMAERIAAKIGVSVDS